MLVGESELEPVDGQLQLVERDRLGIIRIDQIETLADRLVMLHQVVADAFEQTTFPLHGILMVLRVELLLDTLEGIV